jgi:hypothetical protein
VIQALPQAKKPVIAFGNLVWIVAAVASGGLILWLATQGESRSIIPGAGTGNTVSAQSVAAPVETMEPGMGPLPVRSASGPAKPSVEIPTQEPSRSEPEAPTGSAAARPIAVPMVREIPAISFTPEAPKLPEMTTPAPIIRSPFAGFWVFPPMREENKDKTLYLPEFIEASIVERDGVLKGKYRSRYRIRDRAVSPNVNFVFEGRANGTAARLPWRGEGGSRGEVVIKMVSDHSMEVVWTATELGQSLALKSGTAVLMRRPD